MCPLMRPLPGDLADRQSILELKINHSNAEFDEDKSDPFSPGMYGTKITTDEKTMGITRTLVNKNAINVAPFLDELDLVRKELEKKWVPDLIAMNKVEQYDNLYSQLEEVNKQLWDMEDKMCALRMAPERVTKTPDWISQTSDTGIAISEQNHKRSELIKQINAIWGYKTQEKMY